MQFLLLPAKAFLRPLKNQVKLPLLIAFFVVPSLLPVLMERTPAVQQIATALYGFACYMMAGHYSQVQDSWVSLLGMLRSLANGKLVTEVEGKIGGQFLMGHQKLITVVRNLGGIVGQTTQSAQQIAAAARDIGAGNLDLSQRTEEQAATLEQTAAGMEELATTVKANAESCKSVEALAVRANASAQNGGQMVEVLAETMAGIEKSAKKVADIIGVIEGIAFQTSILALNAAVEAARAGEQGRGFAVVAVEVRNLAQRSANAAKEIKGLVDASVESVERGARLVEDTGRVIADAVSRVKEVAARIGEIAIASAEQSAGVEEINRSIMQMDSVTQQNAALVDQATAAGLAFEAEAAKLVEIVKAFSGSEIQVDPAAAAGGAARAHRHAPQVPPALQSRSTPRAVRGPQARPGVLALGSQATRGQRHSADDELKEY